VKACIARAGSGLGRLLLPLALACGSTGVGNPSIPETGTLSLAIVSDDELDDAIAKPALSGDAAAEPIGEPESLPVEPLPRAALQRAVLVLGSVRWIPCNESAPVVTQSGPFLVDLIAGETRPALPEFTVPVGGLCGFEAPLAPARASAEFVGRSLLFSGVRADGVRFVLFANMRGTLRLRAGRDQSWGGGDDQSLLWAMRPRRWAAARELEAAETVDSDGQRTLVIDADRHPLLWALIRARLAAQSRMFFDRDQDGVLDADERSEGQVGTGTTDPEE
jgi:hypothetical protein